MTDPAYYAAHVHGPAVLVKSGPHTTWAEANAAHAADLAKRHAPDSGYWQRAVLVNLANVPLDEDGLAHLLEHDPILRAIYEYGLEHGRMLAEIDAEDRADRQQQQRQVATPSPGQRRSAHMDALLSQPAPTTIRGGIRFEGPAVEDVAAAMRRNPVGVEL